MMRKSGLSQGAWVVVADGEKALILVNYGDDMHMNLRVLRKDEQENPKAQDWAANRPGRFNDGPSVHRSAVQDTDWHVLEKERFAKELAERLYKWAHEGRFDQLVILASRPVLGPLRAEMHQEVADRVILVVAKVVTNHPLDKVETILARELSAAV
ncbi:MAG: baeRF12 domain-containing protein [Paracoccaceae bacterium]